MSTDRELLELAAKAAGIALKRSRLDDPLNRDMLVEASDQHHSSLQGWNPLTDDGDAFRLSVKLYLWKAVQEGHRLVDDGADFYAATRRAIVLAAAEIGKARHG